MIKKGQIYIVASIILIAFIIGIATVSNTLKKLDVQTIEDTSTDLSIEIQKIIESTPDKLEQLNLLIKFADDCSANSGIPTDFYFVVDNPTTSASNNFIVYDSSNESINLSPLSGIVQNSLGQLVYRGNLSLATSVDDKITIKTKKGASYIVPVDNGNSVHYIISREIRDKGERYIIIK